MDHKRTFLLAGALALTVLLAACGDAASSPSPSPSEPSSPSVSDSAPPESTAPSQQPSEKPSGDPSPSPSESDAAGDLKEQAMTFIGQSVDDLIAAIGEPTGSDYAPSCLGSGEDGELFYDGFSVYTYREGGSEIVQDVL